MDRPIAPSVRVLTRPPSSLTPAPTSSSPSKTPFRLPITVSDHAASTSSSSSHSRPLEGVVVVGFIGRRPDDTSQLINRVLDSNIFGSGNLDKILDIDKEDLKDWFKSRRISYYHEEEKGILFLQFCSTQCPAMDRIPESCSGGFASVVEDREFGDLQAMLFMFSVCHVIIYIQEGSHFDTQNLRTFRVLQAAKHALAPYVRSQITPQLVSRPRSSSASRSSVATSSSNNPSPGRSGGIMSRNTSAISLMSGLGSYTSLFPGQCTPVTLFVFIDDFSDVPNANSNAEESTDISSINQSSTFSSLARPSLGNKGSGSVVVLARPMNKSEGSLRKKLQSSLEAQIRFLIKKCRTLSGFESNHDGSRSGAVSSSAPLFSLDASRAVVLLDRTGSQSGESLEFATGLVIDILNGKATSDSLLLESHNQSANKEDILCVKEFIYRQADILRGRGGLVTNANTGSAAGVGMVAVAAAAAAASASAASGKMFNTPELPSLEMWLSSSQLILVGVLSAKCGSFDENEISRRRPRQRNTGPPLVEGNSSRGIDSLDLTVSLLESGRGFNKKFSTLWCKRALPAAKDVYLKDLPSCYPTVQHEAHLEKALRAFHSMVKGPAVDIFAQKLELECLSIWRSERQLCDAVSLTGKPCMHQRHDVHTGDSLLEEAVKPHSSGYVFLHACCCGRSRKLRSDPFDFETANDISSCSPHCDSLLPSLQLPNVSVSGPVQPSSWSLIRVGGTRYYDPTKGLLQSGFCASQKFLLKLIVFLENPRHLNGSQPSALKQGSVIRLSTEPNVEHTAEDIRKDGTAQLHSRELQSGIENRRKISDIMKSDDKEVSFGKGLPYFTMRKPFSEVVAGSLSADSGFPPLQQRKQPALISEKVIKQSGVKDKSREQVLATVDHQSQKSEDNSSVQVTVNGIDRFLKIGSNVVPVNMNGSEKIKLNPSLKHEILYVGFEHECPHGHRFLLNPEHLNELGSPYSLLQESQFPSSRDSPNYNVLDRSKLGKNSGHVKVHQNSNGIVAISNQNLDRVLHLSGQGKEHNQTNATMSTLPNVKGHGESLPSIILDDGGCAYSMLNRNIPIYMNCPYCKLSKSKKNPSNKFASTISQLQRVFMVTPPFPVVFATNPVIQFETSCLPPSFPDRAQKLQFSLGCRVILPPESFLTLRLPFVYGVQLEDSILKPLNPFENQPELTAWITKGTTVLIVSKGSSPDEGFHT